MGSRGYSAIEEPIHRVVIEEDFWMGEVPVTQAQFAVWTRAAKIKHKNHFADHSDHPAENMTWHQAADYCDWLTKRAATELKAKTPEHLFASLPTEAHWEYACRGRTRSEYHTGDGEAALRQAGWFDEDLDTGATHPVRQLRQNQFGLYDMHGNVWEWCLDPWDEHAYRRRTGGMSERELFASSVEHGDDTYRVLRGGSWNTTAVRCRSACRDWNWAGNSIRLIGFRVCLVRSPFNKRVSSPASQAAPTASSP